VKTIAADGTVHLDPSGVLGPECYNAWLQYRSPAPENPEKNFQRVLTAHVTGSVRDIYFYPHQRQPTTVFAFAG